MSNNNMHPEILEGLEYESQYIQKTSGAQRREVKLNRGDSWLLRFLPVKLGPNKRFYARIAKHWLNGLPIVCPRQTEEAYGGNPNAYCPVCDLSEHLNNDRNEDVSKFGFQMRATPQWTTFCVVFQKSVNGGNAMDMSMPEILQPYTFQHYRSTWEELVNFVKQNARRAPDSVLDLEKGNDFYVSKGPKGMRLDKQDSAPIFDVNDPNFDANVNKIFDACKEPNVKMPAEKKLDEYTAKAEELVAKLNGGGGGGGRGRRAAAPAGDQDDLPNDDDQVQDTPTPARSRRAPVQEQAEAPAQPAPTRRAAAPAAAQTAPSRRAAPAPAPAPEPEHDPEGQIDDQVPGDEQPPDDAPPEVEPAPRQRPSGRPAASRQVAENPPPAPARRTATPAAPARTTAPARNGGGAPAQESLDEEENVAEEAHDPAPPAPLVDSADDVGAGEEPPQVEQPRRGAGSELKSRMANRIAAVSGSAKR
jgi:hypothetical protein